METAQVCQAGQGLKSHGAVGSIRRKATFTISLVLGSITDTCGKEPGRADKETCKGRNHNNVPEDRLKVLLLEFSATHADQAVRVGEDPVSR